MWIYQFVLRFLGPRNQWICKILWIEKRAVPFIFLPEWITDGRYQALVLVLHSLWSNSLMYWYKLFFFTESACFTCCTLLSQLLFFSAQVCLFWQNSTCPTFWMALVSPLEPGSHDGIEKNLAQIDIWLLFLELSSKLQENGFSLVTSCTYSTSYVALTRFYFLLYLGFLYKCHGRLIELMEIALPN